MKSNDKKLKASEEFLQLADREYAFKLMKLGKIKPIVPKPSIKTTAITSKTTEPKKPKPAPKEVGSISTYVVNVKNKLSASATNQAKTSNASSESTSLKKMRKWKRVVVYYKAKRDVAKSGFMVNWTPADEAMLARAEKKYKKSRALAAPELIKNLMKKRAARGRGKKRGSTLRKLSGSV